MIIIVACGEKKQSFRCKAKNMYTGSYFSACMNYAHEFGDKVYIISAKYGLLNLDDIIDPYNLRITSPDAIKPESIQLPSGDIMILGGKDYVKFIKKIAPHAQCPLRGGLLQQIKWLNDQVRQSQERKQLKLWQDTPI